MRRLNRTTVYLIVFSVFLLAVNVTLGFILTNQSSAAMRTQIENRMLDVSNTAAAMLDGDILEKLEAEDRDTPEYQNVLKMLTCFEENIELEYIYCVRDMGNGEFVFMIDPDAEDPGEFGEHIPYTDALYQASLGTPSVDKVPYEDSWGRFYSAYSPVFDSQGRVAGIVAVDFSAEWYEEQISHQLITTLVICGISVIFAAAIIVMIAARFRRQFHFILNEMNNVSDGIETLVHEASSGIEIRLRKDAVTPRSNDEMAVLGSRIRSLEEQLSDQISYVRTQAYIDRLTGMGNRAAYEDYVQEIDEKIRNGMAAFAVAVFDLNGLKEINDELGHGQGDQAIIRAASVLKRVFDVAKLFRIGGDEFVAIQGAPYADMAARLAQLEIEMGEAVSKGASVFVPGKDIGFREVFNRADSEMYNDKRKYYQSHHDRRRA